MRQKIFGNRRISALTFFAAASLIGLAVFSANRVIAQQPAQSNDCELRVTLLNNRSKLLENYKRSEDKKYDAQRDKWSKRISYASQWVEKDAEKARSALYEGDKLHKELQNEIDKQIKSYEYLETSPLDCSAENKTKLADALKEVNGVRNRKAVAGQAIIEKQKEAQTEYLNGKFREETDKLIDRLHAEKKKHRAPKQGAFKVENLN